MMDDYPSEFDGPDNCLVCGKDVSHRVSECQCPECPVCTEVGDPECFGTHVAALPQNYTWTVSWDNGHACDDLGTFDSEEGAENAGRDWLGEMVASDPNPVEAAEAYSYEVHEPEEAPNTPEQIAAAVKELKQ